MFPTAEIVAVRHTSRPPASTRSPSRVGSAHAMHTRTARLDHPLIARLRTEVPVPLVLHASSGEPDDELVQAVRGGMAKINIGPAVPGATHG